MTSPTWLLETDVYGDEIEPLAAEIRRQGMECRFVTYREVVKGPIPLPPGSCAIVYGTYPTVQHAMLKLGWTPGGWCSPENLDCAAYYPHFADFLLNRWREILPGVAAIREKDRIFAEFGRDGQVFARPTSVHKLFVGRLVAEDDFETALAPTRYDPETKVLIAEPQEIEREWRLVVAGDEVVAGSQYAEYGARSIRSDCPAEVSDFARAVLAHVRWRPDDLYSGPRKLDRRLSYTGEPGKGNRWRASERVTRRRSRPRWPWRPSRATRRSTSWRRTTGSTRP